MRPEETCSASFTDSSWQPYVCVVACYSQRSTQQVPQHLHSQYLKSLQSMQPRLISFILCSSCNTERKGACAPTLVCSCSLRMPPPPLFTYHRRRTPDLLAPRRAERAHIHRRRPIPRPSSPHPTPPIRAWPIHRQSTGIQHAIHDRRDAERSGLSRGVSRACRGLHR
jgi:hypothetical protein